MNDMTPEQLAKRLDDSDRRNQLRETLRLWDAFTNAAPLAAQIHAECRTLISLWRSELQSRDSIAHTKLMKAAK